MCNWCWPELGACSKRLIKCRQKSFRSWVGNPQSHRLTMSPWINYSSFPSLDIHICKGRQAMKVPIFIVYKIIFLVWLLIIIWIHVLSLYVCVCVCVCVVVVVQLLSHVWLANYGLYSPPGFSVHGILQARTLEWVPKPSFRGSSWSLMSPALAGSFFTTNATWEALHGSCYHLNPILSKKLSPNIQGLSPLTLKIT